MSLFDDFWQAYPKGRKLYKPKARKKFESFGELLQASIILNVRLRAEKDKKWLDGFMPMPTTYLNGGAWEDEWEHVKSSRNSNYYQETGSELHQPYRSESNKPTRIGK